MQQQKAKGRHKTNIERQLERSLVEKGKVRHSNQARAFRKSHSQHTRLCLIARYSSMQMEKRLAERRLSWDKLGRKLLKDINFLFEKHKDRVNDARIGEMKSDPDGAETAVARKQRELRQVEKSLEELKAGEITETKLRTIEDVHKSMLKDLFHSMDDDGGGVLDQQELRALSLTLGYRVRTLEASAQPRNSIARTHVYSPLCSIFILP